MADCLFCSIFQKKIKSTLVYENDLIYAFEDISPQAPVHVVIIPKKHIENIGNLSEENVAIMGELMVRIPEIAKKKGVYSSGFRVVANNGSDGGQTVDHLHIHMLGGRNMKWPPG